MRYHLLNGPRRWIKCEYTFFANTPALYAWGLKPTTANFQVIYINGRTGGIIILSGKKYKHNLYNFIIIVLTIEIHVTRT